jgi:hypothetical protein
LSDLVALLDMAGVDHDEAAAVAEADARAFEAAAPEIVDAVRRLLERVRAGELARAPEDERVVSARVGWL